jgi:vacuolar protein sorting-associated protein 13A/C
MLQNTVGNMKKADGSSCPALNEDDFQRVIFENKLGCDVYLKKLEDTESIIELLQHESKVSLLMPPPRFSDKLNVLLNSTESRYYVVIQIFESKVLFELVRSGIQAFFLVRSLQFGFLHCQGLPIIDDGNGHSYFCALRLLIGSPASDQHKVFPQSARTRCVKPAKTTDLQTHYAKWNEHFIFELPEQVTDNLCSCSFLLQLASFVAFTAYFVTHKLYLERNN